MQIIAITGTLGAGKGTAVEYLVKKHGFTHYSARQFIVDEITKRGQPVNRDTMTEVANDLRKMHGPGHITERLYQEAQSTDHDAVIESIRTLGELETLRKGGNTYLFALDADPRIRYERITQRGSETDKISFEKFIEDEAREMHSDDPTKQNIAAVMKRADYTFFNTKTPKELHVLIDQALEKIKRKEQNSAR